MTFYDLSIPYVEDQDVGGGGRGSNEKFKRYVMPMIIKNDESNEVNVKD